MSENTFRPQADKRKIDSKEEFELCYLRHQYLRRVDYNPTKQDMEPYMRVVVSMAKNNYATYKNLFNLVGFNQDDIVNICRIHLISYLGLFSLEKMPEKYKDFIRIYQKRNKEDPKEKDILDKNKANLTYFLKQRMQDLVRICKQKARNIKGLPVDEYFVFCGEEAPPSSPKKLLKDHGKYGYKKLDLVSFKSIRKKAKSREKQFLYEGKWYVVVPLQHRNLDLVDFTGADMDPYDNIHNMDPEQILFHKQENESFEEKKLSFESMDMNGRAEILKNFIKEKKNDPSFKEEIRIAKKYLKSIDE